jgi:hypothetical protein
VFNQFFRRRVDAALDRGDGAGEGAAAEVDAGRNARSAVCINIRPPMRSISS